MEVLARPASLCPRQVSRRFKATFGTTLADFVESLRMKEAAPPGDVGFQRQARGSLSDIEARRSFAGHLSVGLVFHPAPTVTDSEPDDIKSACRWLDELRQTAGLSRATLVP